MHPISTMSPICALQHSGMLLGVRPCRDGGARFGPHCSAGARSMDLILMWAVNWSDPTEVAYTRHYETREQCLAVVYQISRSHSWIGSGFSWTGMYNDETKTCWLFVDRGATEVEPVVPQS
jgi:hypothetical protein